jgi:hypothetical protein
MTLAELLKELQEAVADYPPIADAELRVVMQDGHLYFVMGDYPDGIFGSIQLSDSGGRLLVKRWHLHVFR